MERWVRRGKFISVASPWATKVKLVDKDLDDWESRFRMTIAYWRVNQKLEADAFPVPLRDGIKGRMGSSTLFSVGDARGMYY